MTQQESASPADDAPGWQPLQADPALRRLDRLVGTWTLTGRTLGAEEDDISGQVVIAWLPGGLFLELRGTIEMTGFRGDSLEVVGYDPTADNFPSTVYSNMDASPARYCWDVQGDVVTHWTAGSKYSGTFNADGSVLSGGWRPDDDTEPNAGNAYDATMTKLS